MKQTKQGFLFRFRWTKLFARLDEKQRSILLDTIFAYSLGEPVKRLVKLMKSNTQLCWEIICDEMQEDAEAYNARCERNRQNGRLGGRPKSENEKPNGYSENPEKPNGYQKNPEKPNHKTQKPNGYFENPIRDKERDKDRDCDKDTERDKGAISLSHKKFCEAFPDRATACTVEKLPEHFDIDRLLDSMKKSSFLSSCKNLDFGWCVNNYDEIISGKYKNYNANKQVAEESTKLNKREYSDEEKRNIFDNFDNLDLEG